MREIRDLLRQERRVRVFFAAHAQSSLGTGAGYVALLVLAYERLESPWAISLVLLADFLPAMFLGPDLRRRGRPLVAPLVRGDGRLRTRTRVHLARFLRRVRAHGRVRSARRGRNRPLQARRHGGAAEPGVAGQAAERDLAPRCPGRRRVHARARRSRELGSCSRAPRQWCWSTGSPSQSPRSHSRASPSAEASAARSPVHSYERRVPAWAPWRGCRACARCSPGRLRSCCSRDSST